MGRRTRGGEDTLELMRRVSLGVPGMGLISDIEEELVVPTMFTSYNRATGVGGQPLRRLMVVHGPNSVGKSVFAVGIAESMRCAGHVPVVFDTEFAAERRWYNELALGKGTFFKMPASLDEVVHDVNKMIENLQKAKQDRKMSERARNIGCCFVVDTITKLLPEDTLEKIRAEGPDRMFPIQAMWLSIWGKAVIPLLYRSNSVLVAVLQEREAQGAKPGQKQWKTTGGKSILYDASQRVRVSHMKKVEEGETVVGAQSFYTVEKNKSDGTVFEEGSFFISNGRGRAPKGFDHVREAIEEGRLRGHFTKKGDVIFCKGEPMVDGGWVDLELKLRDDPALFEQVVNHLNRSVRDGVSARAGRGEE